MIKSRDAPAMADGCAGACNDARAVHPEMESFERWDFVIWQGAGGDAARASLAVRDAVQSAREQVHTIASRPEAAIAEIPQLPRLDVFSTPASSKSSHDALHRGCGVFPDDANNPIHQTVSILR
ncbi:MAG: hypothetical protein ACSHXI_05455 [Hoeflea sp.]|uniref:hypothetical protein n=1 Tax=Hoeflea sp. TaxID=1940281 RepID=UPI003EF96A7A